MAGRGVKEIRGEHRQDEDEISAAEQGEAEVERPVGAGAMRLVWNHLGTLRTLQISRTEHIASLSPRKAGGRGSRNEAVDLKWRCLESLLRLPTETAGFEAA